MNVLHRIDPSWAINQKNLPGPNKVKLRTCGGGLFLILIRYSAGFIQILKFFSIFAKYLWFLSIQALQFNLIFSSSSSAKISNYLVKLTKILSFLYDLITFFFVDILFFRVMQNNQLCLSVSSNLQPGFKLWLCCFLL